MKSRHRDAIVCAFLTVGLLLLMGSFLHPTRAAALELSDIQKMTELGVAESVIISAIEASDKFPKILTKGDLERLRTAGASEAVIDALKAAVIRGGGSVPEDERPSSPVSAGSSVGKRPNGLKSGTAARNRSGDLPPSEVKNVKSRYDQGKFSSAAMMVFDLLSGPQKETFEPYRATLVYYLAKSLYQLEYKVSAQTLLLDVVGRRAERVETDLRFQSALWAMRLSSDATFDPELRNVILAMQKPEQDSRLLHHWHLAHGKAALENGDLHDAIQFLSQVERNSEFSHMAQLLSAVATERQRDTGESVHLYKDVAEREDVVGPLKREDWIRDQAVLQMGLLYARSTDYWQAEHSFNLVPSSSSSWPLSSLYLGTTQMLRATQMLSGKFDNQELEVLWRRLNLLQHPALSGVTVPPEVLLLSPIIETLLCSFLPAGAHAEKLEADARGLETQVVSLLRKHGAMSELDLHTLNEEVLAKSGAALVDLKLDSNEVRFKPLFYDPIGQLEEDSTIDASDWVGLSAWLMGDVLAHPSVAWHLNHLKRISAERKKLTGDRLGQTGLGKRMSELLEDAHTEHYSELTRAALARLFIWRTRLHRVTKMASSLNHEISRLQAEGVPPPDLTLERVKKMALSSALPAAEYRELQSLWCQQAFQEANLFRKLGCRWRERFGDGTGGRRQHAKLASFHTAPPAPMCEAWEWREGTWSDGPLAHLLRELLDLEIIDPVADLPLDLLWTEAPSLADD